MTFNSFAFLALHAFVVVAYFALPQRRRWPLLLVASYYFYMYWRVEYAAIMLVSTTIDYVAGLLMARWPGEALRRRRRWCLVVSLSANLAILFFFKYYAFAVGAAGTTLGLLGFHWQAPAFDLILPVGISFYTFQSMSYTIDVYRGDCRVERHFGIFTLYESFYPQLVAGPIERSHHLLPQFRQEHRFHWEAAREGMRRILWGLFKKVVIADHMAAIVTPAYARPLEHGGLPLWVATYAFAVQIYADFSAYSDIAIGTARMLGFDLMENFRRPYFARSIGEFWHRWHISLSTWFRDYVYIPLGGSRVSGGRWLFNVMTVFLLSGLWHGANWTFVVWGGLHGFWLVAGETTQGWRDRLAAWVRLPRAARAWLARLVCFHLACFGWVFFRAESLESAQSILAHLLDGWNLAALGRMLPTGNDGLAVALALVLLLAADLADEQGEPLWRRAAAWPVGVRWFAYATVSMLLVNFAALDEVPFIYFQF